MIHDTDIVVLQQGLRDILTPFIGQRVTDDQVFIMRRKIDDFLDREHPRRDFDVVLEGHGPTVSVHLRPRMTPPPDVLVQPEKIFTDPPQKITHRLITTLTPEEIETSKRRIEEGTHVAVPTGLLRDLIAGDEDAVVAAINVWRRSRVRRIET